MIQFTDNAIKILEGAVEPGDYVRVGVVGGGCSGLSYTIEVEEGHKPEDILIKVGDVDVCLNPYSNFTLKDVTVDYTTSLHQSGFQFDNPSAAKSCGCGTSFRPEDFNKADVPAGGCATGGCGS
tara:strand:+ start:570 stop:941 length:372 start_codon:yes stop_codon:yes gene_type:complete